MQLEPKLPLGPTSQPEQRLQDRRARSQHVHARPFHGPAPNRRPLIDLTSLFSAPEGAPRRTTAASPPPAADPFQAPDFGEDETFLFEDEQASLPDLDTGTTWRNAR
ncbi:hypothetical protein GCM10027073_68560 [Streptomyces chlorus]